MGKMKDLSIDLRNGRDVFERLGLEEGVKRREEGKDRVSENADDWLSWIRAHAVTISAERGGVSAGDLRRVADMFNRQPHHPNAWGAVFRGKHWKHVGYIPNAKPSAHARIVRVWRYEEGQNQ